MKAGKNRFHSLHILAYSLYLAALFALGWNLERVLSPLILAQTQAKFNSLRRVSARIDNISVSMYDRDWSIQTYAREVRLSYKHFSGTSVILQAGKLDPALSEEDRTQKLMAATRTGTDEEWVVEQTLTGQTLHYRISPGPTTDTISGGVLGDRNLLVFVATVPPYGTAEGRRVRALLHNMLTNASNWAIPRG